jgi:hypothetical protein
MSGNGSAGQAGESCGQKESIQLILHSGFDLSGVGADGDRQLQLARLPLQQFRTAGCTLV